MPDFTSIVPGFTTSPVTVILISLGAKFADKISFLYSSRVFSTFFKIIMSPSKRYKFWDWSPLNIKSIKFRVDFLKLLKLLGNFLLIITSFKFASPVIPPADWIALITVGFWNSLLVDVYLLLGRRIPLAFDWSCSFCQS